MQFEPEMKLRVLRAPRQLFEGIGLQRVHSAEATQPIGETGDLAARPVVFGLDLDVLVDQRGSVGVRRRTTQRPGTVAATSWGRFAQYNHYRMRQALSHV